jgi:hypothetical protein
MIREGESKSSEGVGKRRAGRARDLDDADLRRWLSEGKPRETRWMSHHKYSSELCDASRLDTGFTHSHLSRVLLSPASGCYYSSSHPTMNDLKIKSEDILQRLKQRRSRKAIAQPVQLLTEALCSEVSLACRRWSSLSNPCSRAHYRPMECVRMLVN